MTEPKWVSRQQVEFIHDAVIEMGGGAYGASYAEAISRNHAFVDGNKRTAFYVAVDFLEQKVICFGSQRALSTPK